MVSQSIIIFIIVAIVFCTLFPIVSVIYFKNKEHFSIKTVAIGGLGFFLFVMVLESLLHSMVISTKIIKVNTITFAIYGALAAGIFEEVGRFVMFKFFLKNNRQWKDGLGYGLGHAGIETILIGALSYLNALIMSLAINSGTINNLLKNQNTAEIETVKNSLVNVTLLATSMGVFERVFAFTIQIALTFIVLYAIRERKNIYLLVAILLHALVDSAPALYQMKIITNIYFIEGLVFLFAIISFIFIMKTKSLFNDKVQIEISK
ncbi:YhfC family intramembrane metalloprotease [Clostridium estertheticum]|uniref:YhfC family intramembrane metalloprotease n=1 Tax=Clostridium estertheticum TaxID=238834 RepID=UPI0013E94285|nr:YhfC family intramembrane metalloprotease [Clostridium estertheticum]MBZ9687656.1 YhfC family intramembrane metalloprotease [Clostridium estertheticum]